MNEQSPLQPEPQDLITLLVDFYDQEIIQEEDRLNSRVPHIIQQLVYMKKAQEDHNENVIKNDKDDYDPLFNPWYVQNVFGWEAGHVASFVNMFMGSFYNPRRPVNMFHLFDEDMDFEPPILNYQEIFKMKNEFSRFVCFLASKKDSFKELFRELMSSQFIVNKDKVKDFDTHLLDWHYPCDCADIYNVINDLWGVADDLMKLNCADETIKQKLDVCIRDRDVFTLRDSLEIPLITACQLMIIADTARSLVGKAIAEKRVQSNIDKLKEEGGEGAEIATKAATIFDELRKGTVKPRK